MKATGENVEGGLDDICGDRIRWNGHALRLPREIYEGYIIEKALGEGTYGKVYLARYKRKPNDRVAIKILSLSRRSDGIPATTIKEVSLLKDLKHDDVIELRSVSLNSDCFALIFEVCDTDLGAVLDNQICSNTYMHRKLVRDLLLQILRGLAYVHKHNILHRDIKPQNVLLCRNQTKAKLADFGLSCLTELSPLHEQKNCAAITLWYRPPEVLLGETYYTAAADVWSVGCVFAEMLFSRSIFNASSEVKQLRRLFALLHVPEDIEALFPSLTHLPFMRELLVNEPGRKLAHMLPAVVDPCTADLLLRLLEIDPGRRLTAEEALQHPYFSEHSIVNFRPRLTPAEFESAVNSLIPPITKPIAQPPAVDFLYQSELHRRGWEAQRMRASQGAAECLAGADQRPLFFWSSPGP